MCFDRCFQKSSVKTLSFPYFQVYGSDQEGNSLLIKLTKRNEGNAEIWLILRLKNGMTYTLPGKGLNVKSRSNFLFGHYI